MQHGFVHKNVFMCCSLIGVFTINHRYVGIHRTGLCPASHLLRASENWDEIQEDAVQSQVCSLHSIYLSSQEWDFLPRQYMSLLDGKYCQNWFLLLLLLACFCFPVNAELSLYLWFSHTMWVRINSIFWRCYYFLPRWPIRVGCMLFLLSFPYTVGSPGIPLLWLYWPLSRITVSWCPSPREGPEVHMVIQLQRADWASELEDATR